MTEPRTCDYCGASPPNGYAMIGGKHYCHAGDVPTCYMRAQWDDVNRASDEMLRYSLARRWRQIAWEHAALSAEYEIEMQWQS